MEDIPSYFAALSNDVSKESKQISQILQVFSMIPDVSEELGKISRSVRRVERTLEGTITDILFMFEFFICA